MGSEREEATVLRTYVSLIFRHSGLFSFVHSFRVKHSRQERTKKKLCPQEKKKKDENQEGGKCQQIVDFSRDRTTKM